MRARFLGKDPESHVENSPTPVRHRQDRQGDVHRPGVEGDRSPSIGMLAYELTETVTGHALACLYAAPPRTGSAPAAIVAAGIVGPPLTVLDVLLQSVAFARFPPKMSTRHVAGSGPRRHKMGAEPTIRRLHAGQTAQPLTKDRNRYPGSCQTGPSSSNGRISATH